MNRSRRATPVLAVVALVVSLLLALCWAPAAGAESPQPAAHASATQKKKKKKLRPKPIYWGAWIGDQITGVNPPFDMGGVSILQSLLGKGLSLIQFSSAFYDCHPSPCVPYKFPDEPMENIRGYGAIPFFSWGSESSPGHPENVRLADLAAGKEDPYITRFAEEAREWGHPFFLRFNWEMNGNWFPWSAGVNGNTAATYLAAWHHVHDLFTAVGATNATWVWCPFADSHRRYADMKALYPGNAYVDWTCLDGYNWGRNAVNSQPWRSFDQIFEESYRFLTTKVARRKPVMLAELASSPNGGHKAVWIREMFKSLPRKYPRVRGFIWLDGFDRGIDWPIETSPTATAAFAKGISRRIYQPNRYAELNVSPIPPQP
jgi:hypothetical protein